MSSGFFLSNSDFLKLSERTQADILNIVTGGQSQAIESEYSGGAADLSSLQATNFVNGLSHKTRNVLKVILELEGVESGFWMGDLEYALKCDSQSLSGVWSGLTRRIRTVANDKSAYLIDWEWSEEMNSYRGTFNTVTLKNLKIALNVR